MMKTMGKLLSYCVTLLLVLTSASAAHKRLDSINDLKEIDFGRSVPKHSLILLHWFANTVDIDTNGIISLTFDPDRGDYGSHHYGNYEGLLDPVRQGHQYYSVGNLNQNNSTQQLPSYVVDPPSHYVGENQDRIIIRVQGQMIDQVYITQHHDTFEDQRTSYDPAHTYQITTDLLRLIREFSTTENPQLLQRLRDRFGNNVDDFQLTDIRNTWGDLACLGLLLFIVIEERCSSNRRDRAGNGSRERNRSSPETDTRWETHIRHQKRQNHCCICAVASACILVTALVIIIIFSEAILSR